MHVIRVVLTADDLARVQLMRSADPLTETWRAAHAKPDVAGPLLQNWLGRIRAALGPAAAAVTSVMDSALVQVYALNDSPGAPGRSFGDALDTIFSQPQSNWRPVAEDLGEHGLWPAGWTGLANGRAASLATLSSVVTDFHQQAVAPYWDNIVSLASARYETLTSLMAVGGVGAMLSALHPAISWEAPVLSLATNMSSCSPGCVHWQWNQVHGWDRVNEVVLDGRGIVLRPTTSSGLSVWYLSDHDGPCEITFPVPEGWRAFAAPAAGSGGVSALAELLGSTRSWVLEALTGGAFTTSALARMVGISNASASEHASALRAAGLVISIRDRNAVNHHATELGVALVRQARSNALINSARPEYSPT